VPDVTIMPFRCSLAVMVLLPCMALADPTIGSEPTLLPPVGSGCISSPFGPRVLPNHPLAGTYHNGVDMPAPAGAAIRAVAPGTLIRVQRKGPGGLEILVQHDGFVGIYSHLGMVTPAIADGQRSLSAGEKIGVVGHSGVTYGMHVYFEILKNGHAVDPAPLLGLPLCNGGVIRRPSDMLAADGKIPPTRHYAGLH
jgi:murein DD-endopeptidase MepM/ murein hydrolase activator NlpD